MDNQRKVNEMSDTNCKFVPRDRITPTAPIMWESQCGYICTLGYDTIPKHFFHGVCPGCGGLLDRPAKGKVNDE